MINCRYLGQVDRYGELFPEGGADGGSRLPALLSDSVDIEAIAAQANERLAEAGWL